MSKIGIRPLTEGFNTALNGPRNLQMPISYPNHKSDKSFRRRNKPDSVSWDPVGLLV